PSQRDSCAAIALAAAVIAERDPEAIMGVFSADHLIGDQTRFVEVIREAMAVAAAGYLTTIGIAPTRAESGFGHLKIGGPAAGTARLVAEFKEKPSYELAVQYTESGEYLWNAGMFVFSVRTFLGELARQKPELHEGVRRIAAVWDTPDQETVLA